FLIDSSGGSVQNADNVADIVAALKNTGMKTVAFVDDRALGLSTLLALACDQIVLRKGARIGNVSQTLARNRRVTELDDNEIASLARKAAFLAEQKGHPPALARAMVDPQTVLVAAKDQQSGAVRLATRDEINANPARFESQRIVKPAGSALTLSDDEAQALGLGDVVDDLNHLQTYLGVNDKNIRIDGPSWVDALVTTLNTAWLSWLLLFIGMFMLVLELKLPGIGLPAIVSALAFLLFFWSRYLGGTADQLEIMLFLVGLICLALELFVFPGFGVFGMSGVLLVLVSVVMA